MPRSELELESARRWLALPTHTVLRIANGAITPITPMPARPTAITVLVGSTTAYSSALALGTVGAGVMDGTAADGATAAVDTDTAGADMVTAVVDTAMAAAASRDVATQVDADSLAVRVASAAAEVSTAEAEVSMVVEVDSTVVAADTAVVDTAKGAGQKA
jgi:hypothetical protein